MYGCVECATASFSAFARKAGIKDGVSVRCLEYRSGGKGRCQPTENTRPFFPKNHSWGNAFVRQAGIKKPPAGGRYKNPDYFADLWFQHADRDCPAAEASGFRAAWDPNIDMFSADAAAGVGDRILARI